MSTFDMFCLIGAGGFVLIVGGACLCIAAHQNRWGHRARHEKDKPKEKGPEVGTIRIVEKMREDETLYYIAKRYQRKTKQTYSDDTVSPPKTYTFYTISAFWETITTREHPTPEAAQEEANAVVDAERETARRAEEERQRERETKARADYHKVMGEFKP